MKSSDFPFKRVTLAAEWHKKVSKDARAETGSTHGRPL